MDPKLKTKFIFGEEMTPCKCGSYDLHYQTPIDVELAKTEKIWKLEGPCFIMCFGCGHKGPAVDCSNRNYDDVKNDPNIAQRIRNLWNNQ